MALVSNINFENLTEDLQEMTFYIWGDVSCSFFVAQEKTEKDNAHVHLFVDNKALNRLLLTFVAQGKKQHPPAKSVNGAPNQDKNWKFEFQNTEFDGSQIETALKQFGAKEADATSVQNTFSAIVSAMPDVA